MVKLEKLCWLVLCNFVCLRKKLKFAIEFYFVIGLNALHQTNLRAYLNRAEKRRKSRNKFDKRKKMSTTTIKTEPTVPPVSSTPTPPDYSRLRTLDWTWEDVNGVTLIRPRSTTNIPGTTHQINNWPTRPPSLVHSITSPSYNPTGPAHSMPSPYYSPRSPRYQTSPSPARLHEAEDVEPNRKIVEIDLTNSSDESDYEPTGRMTELRPRTNRIRIIEIPDTTTVKRIRVTSDGFDIEFDTIEI